ncbi:MAG: PilN domain-containing protein [Armatimonadota bacterium]
MPIVNLIVAQREQLRRQEAHKRFLYWLLIGELVVLGLGISVMLTRWLLATGQLAANRATLSSMEPRMVQVKKIETQIMTLKPKLDTLNMAKNNTRLWYESIVNASRSLPANVWLNSLTSTDGTDGKAAVITITGSAAEQRLVGDMMLQMNQKFPKVELHFTQQRSTPNVKIVDFEIGGELMPLQMPDGPKKVAPK